MVWPLVVYFLLSLIISVSAAFRAGLGPAVCAILTSILALIAGGGLRASVFWGDRTQKIGGPVIAALLAALAYWLSSGFSVGLFGYLLTGTEWGIIGFFLCFLFVTRRLAGM